ncbi:FAD-dependent oxidoreductase [Paraburkholderia rhizosphaerae]|uniref:Flavin-dependent dehydrogenase n=1 Tax=Paraburkholderia rhizosphaerae TaxID=480658 RepID=A0A4R8LC91_9BURK|nr:FAD-dependent oxidoreductase [Paraburkholderia rhizosphaerae]TDY40551.1 flavin-dependent dehydrogenase [Paraburkholderia rhizosphaerae]
MKADLVARRERPSPRTLDVAVLGGGPAGCATAIALARRGLAVAILERSRYDTPRAGETLPPESRVALTAMDSLQRLENDVHLRSSGMVSVWGTPRPFENDYIFNPYGHGWHLDRCRFDAMLARTAADAGAHVFLASTVRRCEPRSKTFEIDAERVSDGPLRLRSRFVVDAMGRCSSLLPGSSHRIVYDKLVGLVGFVVPPSGQSDSRMLLEAVRDGWWYSAPLPGNRRVVAYMTDGDQLKLYRRDLLRFFITRLHEAPYTRVKVGMLPDVDSLHLFAASTYRHISIQRERCLKVGDAASAYDPLSSSGVLKALRSGLDAAAAIEASLGGNDTALAHYAARIERGFTSYLGTRAFYYGRERRWPTSPFWQRRHRDYDEHGPFGARLGTSALSKEQQ